MVNYKVVLSPNAKASLRNISDYLTKTTSQTVASKVRKGITEAIKKLANQPQAYEKEHDISDEQMVYRRIFQWDYRIIYFVDEDAVMVTVVQIINTAQNPQTIINQFS